MANPFKNYLSRQQIADKYANGKRRTVDSWNLPAPDYKDGYKHLWLKKTIEDWYKKVQLGKIKKTKLANLS